MANKKPVTMTYIAERFMKKNKWKLVTAAISAAIVLGAVHSNVYHKDLYAGDYYDNVSGEIKRTNSLTMGNLISSLKDNQPGYSDEVYRAAAEDQFSHFSTHDGEFKNFDVKKYLNQGYEISDNKEYDIVFPSSEEIAQGQTITKEESKAK